MVEISYVNRDTANFCEGAYVSLSRPGIGDRKARCVGIAFWIELPGRVCRRDAERFTLRETWINLVARWLQSSNRTVLANAGGRRSYENRRETAISMLET